MEAKSSKKISSRNTRKWSVSNSIYPELFRAYFFWCSSHANSALVFSFRAFSRSRSSEDWWAARISSSFIYCLTISMVNLEKLSCPPENGMLSSWKARQIGHDLKIWKSQGFFQLWSVPVYTQIHIKTDVRRGAVFSLSFVQTSFFCPRLCDSFGTSL